MSDDYLAVIPTDPYWQPGGTPDEVVLRRGGEGIGQGVRQADHERRAVLRL
ncbi:hypothetical protein [Streptomyces sp. NPDC046870]|uniref:hypothetical protein n=1 Tax=Streptomyces sp. NPDC046870 TaxID=3155135 RepID=UPI0034516BB7